MPRAGTKAFDQTVKALKPRDKRYIQLFDGGLGVRVAPTGAKTWVYWFRHGDRKRLMTLGGYPAMSLEQATIARNRAAEARHEGTDPAAEAVAARARERRVVRGEVVDPTTLTVRQAFERWKANDLAPHVDADGTRTGRRDGGKLLAGQFGKWVFPAIGDLPLRSLGKGNVLAIVDAAKAAGVRRTAAVLFSSLRQLLDWCADREYIAANPMLTLKKRRIVGKAVARVRVLDDAELKNFIEKIGAVDLHVVTSLALRFVLATGQRPGEVAGMKKAELDDIEPMWTIPPERYKTSMEHAVPLSTYARSIIAEAARYNAGSDYVFPSPTNPERPIDRHSLSRAMARKCDALGLRADDKATPHDLRRTCRTRMAALGAPDFVAEKVLGHRLEGMLAVYNQHAYLDERRDALERWGHAIEKSKVTFTYVLPLAKRGRLIGE